MKQKRSTANAWLKKALPIFLVAGFFLVPLGVFAIPGIGGDPLIPCGTEIVETPEGTMQIENPCQFCHFFVLIHNLYNFLVFIIVPPLAVVMIGVGGFFWLTAGGNTRRVQQGHNIILAVLAGLVIMYVAWLVVSFAISLIARDIVTYNPANWYNPVSWFQPGELACEPAPPAGLSPEEIRLQLDRSEVPLNGTARLSWSLGSNIAPGQCSFTANPNDPPNIAGNLTNAVQSGGSNGSYTLSDFTQQGPHTYTLTCQASSASVTLNVVRPTLCENTDIVVHWTDMSGNEIIGDVTAGTIVQAILDYDVGLCSGLNATITIRDFRTNPVSTNSRTLDNSGRWAISYRTLPAPINCPGPASTGHVFLEASVTNTSGPSASGSDVFTVVCPPSGAGGQCASSPECVPGLLCAPDGVCKRTECTTASGVTIGCPGLSQQLCQTLSRCCVWQSGQCDYAGP